MEKAGAGIRFLCTSHAIQTPIVTIHEQQWAYCPGGFVDGQEGHNWVAIAPSTISELKWRHIELVRAQEFSPTA